MLVIVGFLLGALWGGWVARSRKGSLPDIAQYAAGYGIAFALAGLLATMFLGWTVFG